NKAEQRKQATEAVTRMDNTRNTLQLTVIPFSSFISREVKSLMHMYKLPMFYQERLETEEYYSREAAGGELDWEEETDGKTPPTRNCFHGLEKEEYHRQEAAGGDSDVEEETEGKTPALEIASMVSVEKW
ncbi:hypothetical protein MAR_021712, partial [Mya arenaria]